MAYMTIITLKQNLDSNIMLERYCNADSDIKKVSTILAIAILCCNVSNTEFSFILKYLQRIFCKLSQMNNHLIYILVVSSNYIFRKNKACI